MVQTSSILVSTFPAKILAFYLFTNNTNTNVANAFSQTSIPHTIQRITSIPNSSSGTHPSMLPPPPPQQSQRGYFHTSRMNQRPHVLCMDTGGLSEVVVNAWSSYNIALEEDPLMTKSITAGIILGAADFAGQTFERSTTTTTTTTTTTNDKNSNDNTIDYARALRFAFFGLALQAPWNHYYYLLLDSALPPTPDPFTTTTGIKVFIDQFIQAPIFTVLIFGFLGLLEGKTISDIQEKLERDYSDTMVANWKLWVPATAVNIAFCPPVLRVLFLNCVFFFWSIFLSLKLNDDGGDDGGSSSSSSV